ncbi:MAG: metallophosphoesterase [Ignavibacteria bacterium]|nr:metallophosphoesterase [Ignavibacteria bacterium]
MKFILILLLTIYRSVYSQPVSKFAVIGDYGKSGPAELSVSNLVRSWEPDFVITLGDNNYDYGEASTIDINIGQYYSEFIYPYSGIYGTGDTVNKFFPSMGNHDWYTADALPYLNYFSLPGNERYYDFVKGNVHFFCINSDVNEPDGIDSSSVQAQWLRSGLQQSSQNIISFTSIILPIHHQNTVRKQSCNGLLKDGVHLWCLQDTTILMRDCISTVSPISLTDLAEEAFILLLILCREVL